MNDEMAEVLAKWIATILLAGTVAGLVYAGTGSICLGLAALLLHNSLAARFSK
jgi:hypothetical protein